MSLPQNLIIFAIKIVLCNLQSFSPCYQQLFTLCQPSLLFSSFGLSIYILSYIKLYSDFSYLWQQLNQFISYPLSPHWYLASYCFKIIPPSCHFCTYEWHTYFFLSIFPSLLAYSNPSILKFPIKTKQSQFSPPNCSTELPPCTTAFSTSMISP